MAEHSSIEWTDATWNPITGCSVVSAGCKHCYAMKLAGTRLRNHPSRKGLTQETKAGPVWTGEVRLNEDWLTAPLRWKRPRMIFVCAHGDLFHENVPDEWIAYVFAVMSVAAQHTYQVLTKREKRMYDLLSSEAFWDEVYAFAEELAFEHSDSLNRRTDDYRAIALVCGVDEPLPNVWLGVSVEDQKCADARIPDLLATPAAIRFVSYEPALGPVDFTYIDDGLRDGTCLVFDALTGLACDGHEVIEGVFGNPDPKLDWIIAGGESGKGARPAHPDWFRSVRDQCAAAGTPFLFKQWGEWAPGFDDEGAWDGRTHGMRIKRSLYRRYAGVHVSGVYEIAPEALTQDEIMMTRVGKKRAGRLLDGVEHNGFPPPRSSSAERGSAAGVTS